MSIKDYLDVSSEEEPNKNIIEKEFKLKKDNNVIDNDYSYQSYKNEEKYENKYYHKNRKHRSRNRHKYFNKSRSRSNNYRNKGYNYSPRKSESNSSSNLSNSSKNKKYYKYDRNRSENSYSNSYSRDKYRYKNKDKKDKNYYNIYEKERYKNNNSESSSNSYHNNFELKKYDEHYYYKKEKEKNKNTNKWTDGSKKEEFKQIKIEKYDKNKRLNEINREREKEISKLKKELKEKDENKSKIEIEKEKPNFEPSGILLKDLEYEYNKSMNNKIIINYNPPSDSIIPNENEIWFLFKFSEDKNEAEETYKLIEKEYFLIGKDPRICDIRIKQKNISRQHAVIQFRKIKKEKEWEIIPYLIDLNSTNGTYLNGDKIDNKKYYELRDKDELNFGDKKIDFVLMKTNQIFN